MGEHLINELSCVVASRKHKETKDGWHIFIMPSPQGMLGPTITMHDVTSYDNKDSSNWNFERSLQNTAEIIVRVLSKGEEPNPANASEGTLPMQ